jgi:hypothetical protein
MREIGCCLMELPSLDGVVDGGLRSFELGCQLRQLRTSFVLSDDSGAFRGR